MKCHEVDYRVVGEGLQLVEVELDPGEKVIAEAGVTTYLENGTDFQADLSS